MMSGQEPLVSVVTPVYNGEQYLQECIESVLAQTYPHWDYTIVNNCSTDQTLEIAKEYAARDKRIRIVNNEKFVSAVENHNIAFRQISAESKYCKVVAADDWIFPECIERMVQLAEKHPSVAIVGAYGIRGWRVAWEGLPYPSTVLPGGRAACRLRLLEGTYVFGAPTSVLFRSDIVQSRHTFYNESNIHADSEACFEFLGERDFGFVHQVLTFERMWDEGGRDTWTTFSRSFNTYLPGVLLELVKYGGKFLSEEELKYQTRAHLRDYYRYLGAQVFKRRGTEFWSYHRGKLAELGYPLRRYKLVANAFAYVLDLLLNPKSTVEKVASRLRQRWSKPSR